MCVNCLCVCVGGGGEGGGRGVRMKGCVHVCMFIAMVYYLITVKFCVL